MIIGVLLHTFLSNAFFLEVRSYCGALIKKIQQAPQCDKSLNISALQNPFTGGFYCNVNAKGKLFNLKSTAVYFNMSIL